MSDTQPAKLWHPGVHARTDGDRPAVIMAGSGTTLTYRALEARSNRLAHFFRAKGLSAGDHIAVLLGNRAEYFETCWAAQRSGLYVTPVNSHLTTPEIGYIVNDCGARALVVDGSLRELLPELESSLSSVGVRLAVGEPVPGFDPYEDMIARCPESPIADETEGFLMLYSSGVTGKPKGIERPL
ncbi:AMP-binding protein, partial [Streptacidiphilus carbonis]|uniref:AMP-binding protein n=1 Tax=Streptacidiphilus carbonis TaxID=105422 RepID=UPI00126A0997